MSCIDDGACLLCVFVDTFECSCAVGSCISMCVCVCVCVHVCVCVCVCNRDLVSLAVAFVDEVAGLMPGPALEAPVQVGI